MQDDIANEQDYVDFGRFCADECETLSLGLRERRSHELSPLMLEAIEELTM